MPKKTGNKKVVIEHEVKSIVFWTCPNCSQDNKTLMPYAKLYDECSYCGVRFLMVVDL